jgi:hypothetical protein
MNYDNATGWLVGEANKGMNAMFVMMNEARLGVAVQGLSQSEVAYQNAVAYARERLQGRALSGPKAPEKPADPIIVHPDVRRTLLSIRAFNEAARALVVWTSLKSDVAHRSSDPKDRQLADDHMGLMTPVLKGYLKPFSAPLSAALGHLQQATMWLMQNAMAKPDNAGAGATDYMKLFGLVALGYMWARMAKVAQDKIAASGATPYLTTKLVTGRFFMERMLPETSVHLACIQSGSATTMELPAEAF